MAGFIGFFLFSLLLGKNLGYFNKALGLVLEFILLSERLRESRLCLVVAQEKAEPSDDRDVVIEAELPREHGRFEEALVRMEMAVARERRVPWLFTLKQWPEVGKSASSARMIQLSCIESAMLGPHRC